MANDTTSISNNMSSTATSQVENFDLHTAWISMRVLSGINSVVFVYVMITQILYCASKLRATSSDKHTNATNIQCAIASFLVFLRVGIPIEEFLYLNSDYNCGITVVFKGFTYGLGLTLLWLVLWLRQRIFYKSPSLKELTSPFVKFLSGATAVVLILGFVGTQILFYTTQKYHGTPDGCLIEEEAFASSLWGLMFGSAFIMQVILLCLFVYPLIKHKQNMRISATNTNSSINKVIVRAAVTSFICIMANCATTLVKSFVSREMIIIVTYVHDVNLCIELMAVIVSFKSWRKRLFPWKQQCWKKGRNESKSFSS